LNPIWILRLL